MSAHGQMVPPSNVASAAPRRQGEDARSVMSRKTPQRTKFRASLGATDPGRVKDSFTWWPNEPLKQRQPQKRKKITLEERIRQELEAEARRDQEPPSE